MTSCCSSLIKHEDVTWKESRNILYLKLEVDALVFLYHHSSEHSLWPLQLIYIWPFCLHVPCSTIPVCPFEILASLMFSLAFFLLLKIPFNTFFPSTYTLLSKIVVILINTSSTFANPLYLSLSDLFPHLCLFRLPISTCSSLNWKRSSAPETAD